MNYELLITIALGLVLANIVNQLVVNPILSRVLGGSARADSNDKNIANKLSKSSN